jgi:hypothetical protein
MFNNIHDTDIDNFIERVRLEWVVQRIQERFSNLTIESGGNADEEATDAEHTVRQKKQNWEDNKTRELDLRRKLLYNMGKYELEEGEVLCD